MEEPPKPDKEVEVAGRVSRSGAGAAVGKERRREEDRVGRDIFDLGPLFLYL